MILHDYDALLLDLDGTVYRGGEAVPGAPEAIRVARENGISVRFVTNNASRPPAEVADSLNQLEIRAAADEVDTSAQAAAAVLAERFEAGATVLVVGSASLADEVTVQGLKPVWDNEIPVDAVVQGLSKDTGWRQLAEACFAINGGAHWVACNIDPTLPTERGLMPGNGALVAALRAATGADPEVAGKPAEPLLRKAIAAADAHTPLVIGDRLDTDIAGAHAVGADALLVLTGVSTAADLLRAPEEQRPKYIAADLRGLFSAPDELAVTDCPQWTVEARGERIGVTGTGGHLELLRALCATAWRMPKPPSGVDAGDDGASSALTMLGLR
jgi:HAD superfamily hydrolase (TIGR01450 family)